MTLLFSPEQYLAAADAYFRGIERRIAAGFDPNVTSVASVFISRWDAAVAARVPELLGNQLGIAIAKRTYRRCRSLISSPLAACVQCRRPPAAPAVGQHRHQRSARDRHPVVSALAAPFTVNTIPEGHVEGVCRPWRGRPAAALDGGDCDDVLARFAAAGIDIDALAGQLQADGASAFVKSWHELLDVIGYKSATLKMAG